MLARSKTGDFAAPPAVLGRSRSPSEAIHYSHRPPRDFRVYRYTVDHVILGGSWVVISRALSRVTFLITRIMGLITPLITTPQPPRIRDYIPVVQTPFAAVWGDSCLRAFDSSLTPVWVQVLFGLQGLGFRGLGVRGLEVYSLGV